MQPIPTSISHNLIKQLASVYFSVDKHMMVSRPSSVLSKHLSDPEAGVTASWQVEFFELFDVIRPNRLNDFQSIIDAGDSMALLTTRLGNFAMRGQFVTLVDDSEHLVFIGAPWLAWMNTNQPGTQLMMNEFKAWDPQLDQLMLLSTERQNIADLQQLTGELKDARDKAERASQVQADFFAIMSHEMRTPLTGVVTALDLIDSSEFGPHTAKMFTIAQNSAENLRYVVDHVLDYSKLQAGGFEDQKSDFNLLVSLQSAIQIIESRAQERRNALSLNIDDNISSWIRADASKIRQVLINLLSNAVKFTENGRIDVNVSLNQKKHLQISVIDTGRGIPLDIQPNIFQPFLTFDANKGEQDSGTGLGLNISRRLVEIMGGTIDFESQPEQGTRFFFAIPIEKAEIPVTKPSIDTPAELSFKGHVLLVEDNKTNQFLSRILLEGRGLTVDVADNGQQAIEKINQQSYDLVFMDISMPVLDGVSATKILRQSINSTQLPIVALTAHIGDSYHKRFIDSGMDAVLNKPIVGILLDDLLMRWLEVQTPDNTTVIDCPAEPLGLISSEIRSDWFNENTANTLLQDIGKIAFIKIANLILEEINQGVQNICSAKAEGEIDKLADFAHSISSNANSLGCLILGQQLLQIETAARGNSISQLADLIKALPEIAVGSTGPLVDYINILNED